jgi:hypothetical protein
VRIAWPRVLFSQKGSHMLRKEVKYIDFNDEPAVEVMYFNLTKQELLALEGDTPGGTKNMFQKIIDAGDANAVRAAIEDFVIAAYGVKSDDGKRFIKNDQLREELQQMAAYSDLIIDLVSNEDSLMAWFVGVFPKDISAGMAEEFEKQKKQLTTVSDPTA